MRKYIFLMGIIMLALIIVSIEPTYGYQEIPNDVYTFEEQNSNTFFSSLIEDKNTSIKTVCTIDFCATLEGKNLKEAVENYKKKYQDYLTKMIGEEEALSTILKGFPITKAE